MIFKPNLCKKVKGNEKNFNLKKKSNFFGSKIFLEFFSEIFFRFNSTQKAIESEKKFKKFQKKIPKKFLIQKKLEFFFKLNFFTFPFSFLQRLSMNIKCPNVGYLKSISSGQYVFIFCVFSLSKISHFNMRHPV